MIVRSFSFGMMVVCLSVSFPVLSEETIFLRDRSAVTDFAPADKADAPSTELGFDYKPDQSFPQLPANMKMGPVSGVGADSQGRVIVLQRAMPPVLVFEASGEFVTSFGSDVITGGHGLSVDEDDNIWVADTVRHVVVQFSPQGKLLKILGQLDHAGDDVDQFDQPTYVVCGPKGHLYVMDGYGNARIVRYRDGGKHPEVWGKLGNGPLEFKAPHSGVIDLEGRLLVCDRDNNRIQILHAQSGELLETWTGYTPFGIAIDRKGTVFIADEMTESVLQLDAQGKVVRVWGDETFNSKERLSTAHLITADRDDNLYTAHLGAKRIQKLQREEIKTR